MAKVQVIIEEVVKGAGNIGGVTKDLKDLDKTAQKSQQNTNSASTAFTEFNSALSMVKMGLQLGQKAWSATVDEMVKYGDQVKKLQTITGQSSEVVSNQIQLADDARVSYESLTAAMRTASKKGIDTSIDGLAKLSEEYKKLAPGVERTQFLMKNFGRGGIEMAKILEMDTAAIKNFKANSGQILSETDMLNIKAYNHSLDGMKDRLESIKGTTSKKLIPVGTFATDAISLYIDAFGLMKDEHLSFPDAMNKAAKAINEEKAAFLATSDAANDLTGATQELRDENGNLVDENGKVLDSVMALSSAYSSLLSSMFNIQKETENNQKANEDLNKKDEDLLAKKNSLQLEMWNDEQGISKLSQKEKDKLLEKNDKQKQKLQDLIEKQNELQNKTMFGNTVDESTVKQLEKVTKARQQLEAQINKQHNASKLSYEDNQKYIEQFAEIQKQQEENAAARAKVSEDAKKAGEQRVYDLAQQKLAADGVVSTGEYEYLQNLAVSMGLVTRASADQAVAENKRANALVSSFEQTLPPMERNLKLMQDIAAFDGAQVDYTVNFQSNANALPSLFQQTTPGNLGVPPKNYNQYASNVTASGSANYVQQMGVPRDNGGSGVAGTSYMIGTGAQPEMFIPNSNGTFVPNADKMGATYNIVINNPKKETAENSIRSALKKLSFTGTAA